MVTANEIVTLLYQARPTERCQLLRNYLADQVGEIFVFEDGAEAAQKAQEPEIAALCGEERERLLRDLYLSCTAISEGLRQLDLMEPDLMHYLVKYLLFVLRRLEAVPERPDR